MAFAPKATKPNSISITGPHGHSFLSAASRKQTADECYNSPKTREAGERNNHRSRPSAQSLSRDFSKVPTVSPGRKTGPPTPISPSAFSSTGVLQGKLVVAAPNDPLEDQAERAADQVMRMQHPALATASVPPQLSRKCDACEDEEKQALHMKPAEPGRAAAGTPPLVNEVLRSPGKPLDTQTRAFFEPRFRCDFSKVRVHSDEPAAKSARAINASAYTLGPDVVFGPGRFNPQTASGKHLLAHELAHVVQQGAQGPRTLRHAMGSNPDEGHGMAGGEASQLEPRGGSPVSPVAACTSTNAKIMRSHLLTSDFKVCHGILKGEHTFHVSDGGLAITANGRWERAEELDDTERGGAERPQCGPQSYNITLSDEGRIYDSEYGTCDFPMGRPVSKQWTDLPEKDYYLKIWVGDHNPACCLEGEIEVAQQAGLSGESCTRMPPGPLEILHDALTLAGMIPALGAVPDLANAGIYIVEGDWKNAGLSVAMALPVLGEGAAAIKLGDKAAIKVSGHAIEKAGAKEIGAGLKEAKAAGAAKMAKEAEAAKAAIAGAEEIKLSQAEYEKALKMVFPSQYVDPVANLVDGIGQRAAKRAMDNPRFVAAMESGNMTLAGTFFHSAAAQEAKAIDKALLPKGWTLSAEETLKAGKGGSRSDILLRGPAEEMVEFDWKTSGKSALSTGSRKEMTRHAGEILIKTGKTVTSQESRSWLDFVRPFLKP